MDRRCATRSSDGAHRSYHRRRACRACRRGAARQRRSHASSCTRPTGQAGGRCRSYLDAATDMIIDNGNHLLLSGNHAALAYARDDRRRGAAWSGRRSANFPSSISRAASAGRCASTTAGFRGGFSTPGRRVPETTPARLSAAGAAALGRTGQAGRRRSSTARAALRAAGASRCCSPRSTSSRREGSARAGRRDRARNAAARGGAGLPAADRARRARARPSSSRRSRCLQTARRRGAVRSTSCASLAFADGARDARSISASDTRRARRRRRRDPCGAAVRRGGAGAGPRRRRPNSAPSSTRISASIRRPSCRRSSASSTARPNGCSRSPAGCRSPSATADRLVDVPREELAADDLARGRGRDRPCRRRCRPGRSCASAARPSRRRRSRTRGGPAPRRAWQQSVSRRRLDATRACRRRSKARSAPATAPPISSAANRLMDVTHDRCRRREDASRFATSAALDRSIASRRRAALLDCQQPRRALGVRARGRCHHPGRICAAAPLSRRAGRRRARSARSPSICAASRATHGGWPLFHDGDFDMSASVKAYFALKMIGDAVDAPHMRARARGDPARAAARAQQRVHARAAGALRRRALARRAGDAGRDHAAADAGFRSISTRFPTGRAP